MSWDHDAPGYRNLAVRIDSTVSLSEPTGRYPVGTAIFHWVDPERIEWRREL